MLQCNARKRICCLLCIAGALLITACGSGDQAQAKSKKKKGEPLVSSVPPLETSFVLREGNKNDITCMAVDKKGNVYAAGISDSNSVIFKLHPKLKKIKEMVKFGSARDVETIKDMVIDSQGNIFVTGSTRKKDFPVTKGCYDSTISTHRSLILDEVFVVKFSPDLKMLASTFIGGDGYEKAFAIAVDRHDNIYVAGYSEGVDTGYMQSFVPPARAYDPMPAPEDQAKAFVVQLGNNLSTLKAATLLGGDMEKYDSDDEAYDLAIDGEGNVWVTGQTNSDDFPVTPGCVGPTYSGKGDIFVSKLSADLSRLLASTYLGGLNQEMATAMVLDKKGNVFVGGWTESPDLPMVPGCFDTKYSHEEEDAFIVKLNGDLSKLLAATFLGGDYDASGYGDDLLSAMALSGNGKLLCVTGRTESENFPVTPGCYKNHTSDDRTASGTQYHRNERKPRERSTTDKDYGDGFIALFDTDLTKCRYATYLGGDSLEYVDDILFDGKDILLAGVSFSYDFPRITTREKEYGARGFAIRFNWKKSR